MTPIDVYILHTITKITFKESKIIIIDASSPELLLKKRMIDKIESFFVLNHYQASRIVLVQIE